MSKSPDTLYSFFETSVFIRQIEDRASMKVLFAIEDDLLKNPERGDVIQGTHGAGKPVLAIRISEEGNEAVTGAYTRTFPDIIT